MLNESSVAAQGSTDQTLSVTLADNDKLLQLKVSQRFLLNLGDGYTWTVEVDNQAIISRVVNITVVRGAQGVYEAHAPGQATLTATGDPVCRQSKPPCGMPSRVFTLHVTVQ